ncbi:MAG: hypothetical protein HC799_18575, partial [Limnothrix sp. RL_2_0]|nr:hypothetical protein [Limnothrix sp. RL_2_0]
GDAVYDTLIPETVKLREAPSHSQSIFDYDPSGKGRSPTRISPRRLSNGTR